MTGAYLRIERDRKWENIEVEHLTSEERMTLLGERTPKELLSWLDVCCRELAMCERVLVGTGLMQYSSEEES